ncbi:MAG: DUF2550 domain-containing protein [Acidobacteria bacterium]|nr:DUF2550 domain-containing protein [Acidobacteriota bacterium]
MNEPGTAFVVIAVIFAVLVLLLILFGVRRFYLRRTLGTADASLSLADGPWRMGVCRYQDAELQWYNMISLSPSARYHFRRSSLELLGRRAPKEAERSKVQPDVVIVLLRYEQQDLHLAMKFEAYTGLSSWLEAGPVVGIGTWR